MKIGRICIAIVVIIAMLAVPAFAKVWRIDNNTGNQADFRTLQAAHDSTDVLAGDTLYVAGSAKDYGSLTLTKQLHIVGPGYFLGENPDTQATVPSALYLGITFKPGSEGSSMTGMSGGSVFPQTDNITVKRNKLGGMEIGTYANPVSNTLVLQNYISTSGVMALRVSATKSGTLISNNLLIVNTGSSATALRVDTEATVAHNVIKGHISGLTNTYFHSNILHSGTFYTPTNSTLKNNICNEGQFGTESNNKTVADMTTVFVSTGSTDGQWQLKEGSPAKGAGLNGDDCGAFDGNNPYVLSGIPAIPNIYHINAPSTGSPASGLPVQVKVKSRD